MMPMEVTPFAPLILRRDIRGESLSWWDEDIPNF